MFPIRNDGRERIEEQPLTAAKGEDLDDSAIQEFLDLAPRAGEEQGGQVAQRRV